MEVEHVRDVIAFALEHLQKEDVKVVALGNRVHLYQGDREFEIVIRTMDPKGSSRLAVKPLNP
jgi:hypothetical protein